MLGDDGRAHWGREVMMGDEEQMKVDIMRVYEFLCSLSMWDEPDEEVLESVDRLYEWSKGG